jgi:hypothetical protein
LRPKFHGPFLCYFKLLIYLLVFFRSSSPYNMTCRLEIDWIVKKHVVTLKESVKTVWLSELANHTIQCILGTDSMSPNKQQGFPDLWPLSTMNTLYMNMNVMYINIAIRKNLNNTKKLRRKNCDPRRVIRRGYKMFKWDIRTKKIWWD